ncbi:hypothetical protein PsorP6_005193 [Peronosclerospora sorghi]|uniref:Uncharacterized protein n=1 Tax=Peronosclerospora sorghi TaxID=230839 RepID=A0ACC0W4U6_9STRA|nr:hypothetical protein PsorP6_005193 [Peronosclerospora sorghi]
MSVPAWTREWRPLVKQLCVLIGEGSSTKKSSSSLSHETLLLRADRVIGQLYAHQFVDSVPNDVQTQTQALATNFRIHSLDDRAENFLHLAAQCDYRVLKLLLELANSPTRATEEEVDVDQNPHNKWKVVLVRERARQAEEEMLQNQLLDEFCQIARNDEWYQAWDSSEEEESGWDMSSADEGAKESGMSGSREEYRSNALDSKRKRLFEQPLGTLLTVKKKETVVRQLEAVGTQHQELDEETMLDEIMCRYYPEVTVKHEEDEDVPTCELQRTTHVPFTMERPWLLCESVVKDTELATNGVSPRRLIHEESVVTMVFEALDGVDSLLFECRSVIPTPSIFSREFQTHVVEQTPQSQNVAVGHLSPLAFRHVLADFASAASELHVLRDFLEFLRGARNFTEHQKCSTLQGLANSLSEILIGITRSIRSVESETSSPAGSHEEDPRPWSRLPRRQPTLLGIYGGLKEIFKLISWLKMVLIASFQKVSGRDWHKVKCAELAKCVLDSLYHMMVVEYVEYAAIDTNASSADKLSQSDVLLNLFVGALNPYLDLMNQIIFEVGYSKTTPLDDEQFFVTPGSLNVDGSKTCSGLESFEDGILSLAPLDINRSLVPTFLESKIDLMKEAFASRQLTNHFIQHQHCLIETLKQRQVSLRKLLTIELEALGCRRIGDLFSMKSARTRDSGDDLVPSQHTMLACAPFNRILERCLTRHIETKCLTLNGELADLLRDKMNFLEHVEALRMFVLMEQQDVFTIFSEKVVTHMHENPVAWADSETINSFHQSAIQGVFKDNVLSSLLQQLGSRMYVRVDFSLLDKPTSSARIDIATMRCIYFTLSVQQPLGVLFSKSIMLKYSRLGVLLVQVKAVEAVLIKFKSTLRHRRTYAMYVLLNFSFPMFLSFILFTLTTLVARIEKDLHQLLVQIADMLHYTQSVLSYLTSQHATVFQYILTTFNHILHFVGHVDEFVSMVDRNLHAYITKSESEQKMASTRFLDHSSFRLLRGEMTTSSTEFQRQAHFLVVMLTSMKKYDASSHVNEILTHLNFNYFYHKLEHHP